MCLYSKLILNRKYIPNTKNGGNVPKMTDWRTKYVPIGCGNCIECRKQKARAWQVRLCEELKTTQYSYFITLTFSNESLEQLEKECEEKDVNTIATLAVRRFLERWRKTHKKSLRHWLITELGQENTERIHIHGILFPTNELNNETLQTYWKYGRTDIGQYCNTRTINYIIKYVTKLDNTHKNYRPVILCSAGLGREYVERNLQNYKYRPLKTKEYYRLENGAKVNLPIYYRNKFFNEEEREHLWCEKLDQHRIFVNGIECRDIDKPDGLENYGKVLAQQQTDNIALGYGNDTEEYNPKKYFVTLKMLNKKGDFVK